MLSHTVFNELRKQDTNVLDNFVIVFHVAKKTRKQMLCAMELYFIVYQNSSDNSSLQSVILLVGLAYNANTYVTSQHQIPAA